MIMVSRGAKPLLSASPGGPEGREFQRSGLAGGRGVEPGGGDLGEFTCGKRWGSIGVCVSNNVTLQVAIAHGPLVSPKGSVAGSPVGLAPPIPATEPMGFRGSCVQRLRQTF